MADVDLGALKFKIGLDDSSLDKQIKDIQKKLQDTFNQEMSFKPMLTDIGKMNDELSEVVKKINKANENASKVGKGKSNKKMDILVQMEELSNKIVEATREYDKLEKTYRNIGNAGGDKGMDARKANLESQKKVIDNLVAELNRLKTAYSLTANSVPKLSISDERELNLLRQQYEMEIARTKEMDKQASKQKKMQQTNQNYIQYLSGQSGLALGMPEGSAEDLNKKIAAIRKRLEVLNNFKVNIPFNSNQITKIDTLIQKLQGRLDKLQSSLRKTSTSELLNINPTSINQANNLISELTNRRNALNTTDANYNRTLTLLNRKIQEHNKFVNEATSYGTKMQQTNQKNATSSKEFTEELTKQSRMMREFVNTIKTYAGFYFFRDMFQELVAIRGEFELQQVSLRAIIQDARRADQIFSQIKGLAVISPFQFSDLVGYTKQLAAFQIPVNELYGTMKSLADVSAGLGVDMGRIILAYGQIRSAGVLRGQELRQLTEAGIPALDALRKKLEEVRGVAQTTDDVFSAISTRQIPFEYIREMFTTMTEDGGMFYKMQEIQAASLKGMVSNLADSYKIMMNDIGEANDSVLKGIVGSITDAMNNWRYFSKAIEGVAVGYAALKGLQLARTAMLGKEVVATTNAIKAEKLREAQLLKQAAMYRTLTTAERWKIATASKLSAVEIAAAVNSGKMSAEMAKRILATNMLTQAERHLLVTELKLTGAEAARMLSMTKTTMLMNRFKLATFGLTNSLKTLWLTIKANPLMTILTVAGLVAEAFHVMSARSEEFNQKIKDSAKSFRESYSDLQKDLDKINFDKLTPENLEQLDTKQLQSYEETLTGVLSKYGNIGQSIIQQNKGIDNAVKRVEFLQRALSQLESAYKLNILESDMFLKADKASDASAFFWQDDALSTLLKDYEESAVALSAAGNRIEQFRGEVVDAAKEIAKVSNNTEKWTTELNELINKGASAATIIEKVRSLAVETKSVGSFQLFTDKVGFDSNVLLKEYDKLEVGIQGKMTKISLSFNKFARYVEQRLVDAFGSINLKDEAQLYFLKSQIEQFTKAQEFGENARRVFEDLAGKEWQVQIRLDDKEAQEGLTGWKKSLDEITGHKWTIAIKAADVKSMEDYFKSVKQEYKDAKSSIENLQRTIDMYVNQGKVKKLGDEYQITGIVSPYEAEQVQQTVYEINAANEAMSKATGTAKQFNLELEKQKKEAQKRDPLADLWKNRLSLLESAYSKFKDLSINIGKEEAKKQIEAIYGSQALKLGVDIVYDKQAIVDNYNKAAKELETRVPQDAVKNARKAAELSSEIYVDAAKKVMKRITDEFDRYKNKYDFYSDILGITGDSELALDLAVQFSGDTSTMAESFAAGIYNNLQSALAGMNLDLGVSVVPDTSSFTSMNQYINQIQEAIKGNKNIGEDQKEVIQGMIDAWKGYFGEMAKQYANDLAEYGDYYTQVDIIREKYRKKIEGAKGMENASLISALQKSEEMDLFKLTTDYQNFFGAVEAMSMEAANTVADKVREMLNSAFRSGAISAKEYMKELERVDKQIEKMMKNNQSDLQTYMKDGIEGLYNKRYDAGKSKMMAGMNDMQQAMADIENASKAYEDAMKNGDEKAANAALSAKSEAESRYKSGQEAVKTGKGMMAAAQNALQTVNLIDFIITNIYNAIKAMQQIIASVSNLMDSMGKDTDSGFMREMNQFSEAMGVMNEGVKKSWDSFKSGDFAGAIGSAISMPLDVIATFNRQHDKRLQKHIENLQFEAKKLTNIYNMLEKEFEHIIDPAKLDEVTSQQVSNLKEQLQIQKDILAAEEDKKKTDREKVEDYKQTIKELEYEIRYYTETLASELYSIDLKDWASQIGDALVEAWLKGEDAAKAYKDTVADVMRDVVKSWVQRQYIEKAMQQVQTTLFGADGKGGMFADNKIDKDELIILGNVMGSLKSAFAEAGGVVNEINNALGGMLTETEENAEGLSNAIAGVDENTFNQALGYLNGMRYEMVVQSDLLRQLVSLNGGSAGTGGTNMTAIQQSQLEVLTQQLAATMAIKTALLSVVSIAPRSGGNAIKVIID
jgi:tape measure domain-containing protein|nr:MAG TPA: tail tape measure [Caudoviricetes sp.]